MRMQVLNLKHRLRILKELCKKLNINHLKKNDTKILFFHLKRLLTTLHILLFDEVLNIENSGCKNGYIQYLLFKTIKIIFKSEFVVDSKWELVQRHGLVNIDTRTLIERISSIIAFSRIRM